MKPLDDELRSLFKRQEPSEGFAEWVLERIETAPPRRNLTQRIAGLRRRPALRWIAAATVCLLVALGVARYEHQRRARAQAEQASQQAIWALEVASAELNTALEQARRITVQALAAPQNTKTRME